MMTDVILIGEPLGLFTAQEYGDLKDVSLFKRSLAGAEVNVGIGLSRLNYDIQYITKVGDDPIGEYIVEAIEKENIGTRYVSYAPGSQTGLMMKNKVKDGDPKTAYFRKHSAFSTLSESDVEAIDFSEVKLIHVTGIPPAVSETVRTTVIYLLKKAREAGTFITFDPNLRPALWSSKEQMIRTLNEIADYADVVLPGISEAEILVGTDSVDQIAQFYLDKRASVVIVKSGEEGAFVCEKGNPIINVKGFKVSKVIDTVGAGDGFAVGVLHGYLSGLSWEEAAVQANAIGSIQVQHEGDNEGLPTLLELDEYVNTNR
ncbi:MAG: sugar kinase [Alkalibacterium sp.]|nr:sugar kinase [Alkalibacterium sp.]